MLGVPPGGLVTITVYNADGTVYASATDSIESYCQRFLSSDALFEA